NGIIKSQSSFDSVINQGTISADTIGTTLTAIGVINQATMQAINGGILALSGPWSNAGTINETNSTLYLAGNFTVAQIGTINRSGGTVNLAGILDNTGTTLALDAVSGSWSLNGG